jgi:protein-S-isoprenylcysteine O-methyltransferase Ste14
MNEPEIHHILELVMLGMAVLTFVSVSFLTAPYGRHSRAGYGPTVPPRVGWVLMESPAVIAFIAIFVAGERRAELAPLALLGLWQIHYVHRTFVFPLRMRPGGKGMPIGIVLLGMTFNGLNAYLNARWISHFGTYAAGWLVDPRFLAGAALFFVGLVINYRADATLFNLRRPGESGYKIPRGGLYELVSCPNYLGELLEWAGWALATWSLSGLAFAVYTAANLAPRAIAHHRWYRRQFPDYPPRRKALIPFVV